MLKYIFFVAGYLFECTALAFCFYSEWTLCIISTVVGFVFMQPALYHFSVNSMQKHSDKKDTSFE